MSAKKRVYEPTYQTRLSRKMVQRCLDLEIKKTYYSLNGQRDRLLAYQRLLIHVQGQSDLVRPCMMGYDRSQEAIVYLQALARLSAYSEKFIRHIEDWVGGTGSARDLFHSLFQHLLAKYSTPRFFDSVWIKIGSNDNRVQCLQHISIAQGENVRRLSSPVKISRRMGHFFLKAPDHFSYIEALRYGQLKAMDAKDWLLDEVKNSRLGRYVENEDFWQEVMRYLVSYQEKGLDRKEVRLIIDFLQTIKFHHPEAEGVNGAGYNPHRDPLFSLAGRKLNTLLELVNIWNNQCQQVKKGWLRCWKKSSFSDFNYTVETGDPQNPVVDWNIQEILDSDELYWEGRILKHCVQTYIAKCFRGYTTIWSMARLVSSQRVKVLTIELNPSNCCIVQIRGRHNRKPKRWELEVIREWANRNSIKI